MRARPFIAGILIVFVAASLVYLFVKETMTTASDADMKMETIRPSGHKVTAYYFHGFQRCKTCLQIESWAKKVIETAFPDELEEGQLEWRAVNYEEEANAAMAAKYELVASSLVIVEFWEGRETRWKTLEEVWELVGEEESFAAYVKEEVRKYLNSVGDDG